MSIPAFRITKTKYVATAFNGEGARLSAGRWNSKGTTMVYFAGSLSGATLEILVHTDDYGTIDGNFSYIPVGIPETCVDSLDKSLLPPAWNSPVIIAATQTLGDEWISSSSSAILRVPSAITQGEYNFLGNPAHPDFSKLKIGPACEFKLDARL